jgi:DNA-binding transcriptional MerR regulator
VATLKFYLREGLLHAGEATAVNQAEYDDVTRPRVKLVRALLHLGRLSIADARRVHRCGRRRSDAHPRRVRRRAGRDGARSDRDGQRYAEALAEVDRFVARHGLQVRPDAAVRQMLADALVGLEECDLLGEGCEVTPRAVRRQWCGDWWSGRATRSRPRRPTHLRAEQVEHTVVGTVVFEVAYAALRRMALEHASAQRWSLP